MDLLSIMGIVTLVAIIIVIICMTIMQRQREQIIRLQDENAQLEDACKSKDDKLDVLIRALGQHQITIQQPRGRR